MIDSNCFMICICLNVKRSDECITFDVGKCSGSLPIQEVVKFREEILDIKLVLVSRSYTYEGKQVMIYMMSIFE